MMANESLASWNVIEMGLLLLAVSLLLSACMIGIWRVRKLFAALNVVIIGASTGLLLFSFTPVLSGIFVIIQAFRVFAGLRVIRDKLGELQAYERVKRTEWYLSLALLASTIAGVMFHEIGHTSVLVLVGLQLFVVSILFRHAHYMRRHTSVALPKKFMNLEDVPSVTVAIPARNQTDDLAQCLQSILRINYPKLEILVLDDCSQDKTSDIIRSFAHRGVRFLQGTPPPPSWLAKNWAYEQLLDNASGELVLFCGTDVRFEPQALRALVEVFEDSGSSMISVLPIRDLPASKDILLQPMRYYRELVFISPLSQYVPSLSTCWVARRKSLIKHGGFKALKKSIRPERIIARGMAARGRYRFIAASSGIGISSKKGFHAQWQSAVRTRYPELRNRPESVAAHLGLHIFTFMAPFLVVLYGLLELQPLIMFIGLVVIGYLFAIHIIVSKIMGVRSVFLSVLVYPSALIMEVVTTLYSMWAYEFSEVIWKGRNICMPVLKTNLRLPKL